MPCWGSTVAALDLSSYGATRWVIPMTSAFACIVCHAFSGARKGETISGCTRKRGARYARGTETLSGLEVSRGRQG